MARPKSKGAYVPLAASYFMDDAILEAGPDAELLFVRCLSFLASSPSDGFITERQVLTIAGIGLRNVPKRLAKLIEVGLLEATTGGFVVRSWTKWNKSAEEVGRLLARDRERKAQKHGENTPNSARNPDGIQTDSTLQSSTEQSSTEQMELLLSDSDESDPEAGTLIPPEWRPNQSHIDKAAALHLDVKAEYLRFRDSAERKHRRLKNWNTGFTNWLRKQAEFNQERQGRPTAFKPSKDDRARDVLEMGRRLQEQHEHQQGVITA